MTAIGEAVAIEELMEDPYPIYAQLRSEAPVCWIPSTGLWFVTRWEDVVKVATFPEIFTAELTDSPLDRTCGQPTVLTSEGSLHARFREIIKSHYTPRSTHRLVETFVRPLALQRVEEIRDQGHADLLADYFEPISILAQAVMLGIDREGISSLRNWVRDLAIGASNFDKDPIMQGIADAASSEMSRVLQPMIEQESAQPSTSLISDLLHRGRGERCPRRPDEVLPTLKVLMIGGAQEPGHASASTLHALFCHPNHLRDVQEDSSLLGSAVNETLRWMSPIGTQTRQTTRSVTIAGSRIPQGERVAALISSANRDKAIFQEPDRFDIYRGDGRNAAFGFGSHACVGSLFTRKSAQVMLEVILHALPNMRPDDSKPTLLRGWEFRGPLALHVVWD